MIIVALIVMGLLLPFALIYGPLLLLLFVPVGATIRFVLPHWYGLSLATRRQIRRRLIWISSTALWLYVFWSLIHH